MESKEYKVLRILPNSTHISREISRNFCVVRKFDTVLISREKVLARIIDVEYSGGDDDVEGSDNCSEHFKS